MIVFIAGNITMNSIKNYYYNDIKEEANFIGRKSYEGHPVYDFMISDSMSLAEEIRQDTLNGIYYKYGYVKAPAGDFETQQLLDEMQDNGKFVALSIGPSKDTEAGFKANLIIGFIAMSIILASLFYTVIVAYNKNKKLISWAYYDPLTGLPNREYLKEFLSEEIAHHKGNKKAILLINCCNFRTVNLTYGFQNGDKILQELADKLKGLSNLYKMLFRFTPDRYVLYVENFNDKNDLIALTNKVSAIFNNPFKLKDINQFLVVQIGIVEIDNKYDNVDRLLTDVSISLTTIKNNNNYENYAFFNEDMENKLQRVEMIERELRTAISEKESKIFYLEYQPLVDLKTNRIIGFEALARMKTESLGHISPIEFIDVAERKQLIVPLGSLILKTACDFIRNLNVEGFGDIKVAVNTSGIQLLRDDFIDTVMSIIKKTKIRESSLELEITESILLDNYEIVNEKLKSLRDFEIRIALDDFGTGYSSFSRLRELNIDVVKIDKYFISNISITELKELITGDIISMAHKLGLRVVAEGVEVEAQKKYLVENNCDTMQGYLFSKPLSQEEALKILKSQ